MRLFLLAALLAACPASASDFGGRLRSLRRSLGSGDAGSLGRIFDASAPGAPAAPGGVPAPAPGSEDPLEQFLQAQGVPRKQWPAARTKIDGLWKLMSAVGIALGDQKGLEFRVGEWWMTDTQAGVVFLPLKDIVENMDKPAVLLGGVAHEAGHVFWTRFADLPEYETLMKGEEFPQAVHNLFNVLEDMFQERTQGRMWPGLPYYLTEFHTNYRGDLMNSDLAGPDGGAREAEPAQDKPAELLPHEQYLEFLRAYWMAGKFPDPASLLISEVRQAAEATRESARRLGTELPLERRRSEPKKLEDAQRRYTLIHSEIYPAYKALLKMSEEQLRRQQQQQGQGQGQGQGRGQGSDKQQIEKRAEQIARKYFPTHGDEDELKKRREERKKQQSVPLDPKQRQEQRQGQQGQEGGQEGEEGEPSEGNGDQPSDPIDRLLERNRKVKKATTPSGTYEEHLLAIAALIDAFSGRLEQMFQKNLRPAWEGYFKSGPRPNIKRWMRSESRGWTHPNDFKVFEKRREPTRRDYKFRLLMDVSGSMRSDKKKNAARTLVLFMEVLDRLGMDFSIVGFNDDLHLYKDFDPNWDGVKKMAADAKRRLVLAVDGTSGGLTHDTEAIVASVHGAELPGGVRLSGLEQQPGEGRYLIVVTDGEGNGPRAKDLEKVLADAAARGIVVIGVGIGDGITHVQKRYPSHVTEPDVANLPDRIGDLLARIVREGVENGVPERLVKP